MSKSDVNKNGFIYNFKKFLPLLNNLVSRDFKIKYRRSVLGIAWSVLNPLLTMIVLTNVFKLLLRIDVPNFATYYIMGYSIWNFFSESTSLSLNSILGAASLIKKVYIPKYMFPLEKALFSLVNFLFSMIAVFAVMMIQGVFPTWTSLLFPIPVIYCFIFSCGMCLILSAITVYFRDVAHFYSVLLSLWVYLTPILYPITIAEGHPLIYRIIKLNPLTHYVEYFRAVMMYNTIPSLTENAICLGMSVVVFGIGCLIFNKAQKNFILHI